MSRFGLHLLLPEQTLIFLYFPFIFSAVIWLGLGPGLLCTAVCATTLDWFWLSPVHSLAVGVSSHAQMLVLFTGAAVLTCLLVDRGRRSRMREHAHGSALESEVKLRQEASAVARDREARLEAILRTAVDGIITIDERGIIESVNPAAERLFGYAAAEMVGRNVRMLMPAPYEGEHDGYLQAYLGTGVRKIIGIGREVEGRRKDGSNFPMHLAVSEVPLGGTRSFTGFVHDLTERKRLEREFLQSQKMEVIGGLAGGIAHDFNNLLMGILACSRMAASGLDPKTEAHHLFEEVGNAARRGIALTRRLLSFTRRQPTELHSTSINRVVQESETMLRQLLGEDIVLRLDLAPSGAHVRADEGLIDQILVNLLVNARDAMTEGGEIVVSTSEQDGSRPEVALSVTDAGCGIPADIRERIFEPFFSTKGIERGTGLGLSTVKRIVEQLAGRVEVQSEVGRGTTFRLTFARARPATEREPMAVRMIPRPSSKRILIVEDDRLVRAALQRFLKSRGWFVLVADGPGEALAAAAKDAVDVLLTDMVLPGINGTELAARIQGRRPDVTVIFMSAHPAEVLVQQGRLQAGANYIEKPFEMELLEHVLQDVCPS